MSYSVLIIGLGQIGMDYDYDQDTKSQDIVLTHAQAVSTHLNFELLGGVDTRIEQREKFSQKFKRPTYESVSDALSVCDYDVVVISVSTDWHLELCKTVLSQAKPKLILLEKPLAYSSKDSLAIIELSQAKGVPIAINYFRFLDFSWYTCGCIVNGVGGCAEEALDQRESNLVGALFVRLLVLELGRSKRQKS